MKVRLILTFSLLLSFFTFAPLLAVSAIWKEAAPILMLILNSQETNVGGIIFNDANGNNICDVGENGIAGVRVCVDSNSDGACSGVEKYGISGYSGHYGIEGLAAGDYTIITDPTSSALDGYQITSPNYRTINLATDESYSRADFCFRAQPNSISGLILNDLYGQGFSGVRVYIDLNGNGIWDVGEPFTFTNDYGYFSIKVSKPGTYTIRVDLSTMPPGYFLNGDSPTISFRGGESVVNVDISFNALPAAFNGRVWYDMNKNGKFDTGEVGIDSAAVFADLNNNGIQDSDEPGAISDAEGLYMVGNIAPGVAWLVLDTSSTPDGCLTTTGDLPVYRALGPGITYTANIGCRSLLGVENVNNGPLKVAWGPNSKVYVSDQNAGSVFIHNVGPGLTGISLTGEIKDITRPLGVAVDPVSGDIYVGSIGDRNIRVYSSAGKLLRTFGDDYIEMPNAISIDRYGRIYVADSSNRNVTVYNSNGSIFRTIGMPGEFQYPTALDIMYRDEGGTEVPELFVGDRGSHYIRVYDLTEENFGTFKRQFGGPVEDVGFWTPNWIWEGLFTDIQSIAHDQHGVLHVLDGRMGKAQMLDPVSGVFIQAYDAFITMPTNVAVNTPRGLAIDGQGRVVVSNEARNAVEIVIQIR